MSPIVVRLAKTKDASKIAHINASSWIATYPNDAIGLTKNVLFNKFTQELIKSDSNKWIRYIEDSITNQRVLVVEHDNNVVGYCNLLKNNGVGQIYTMYIDPNFIGKGAGGMLMRASLDWLKDCPTKIVEVISYNSNAIGFYEYYGFQRNSVSFALEFEKIEIPVIQMELT